jgi:hypothetical protein
MAYLPDHAAFGRFPVPCVVLTKVAYLAKPRVWKCYATHSRPSFSLKTGTIFEDSPIAMEKWLPTVWMLLNCENGISSWELYRALGVTQKTAWFMLHRIRPAAQSKTFNKPAGEVEDDEIFIGGKARYMRGGKREDKTTGRGPQRSWERSARPASTLVKSTARGRSRRPIALRSKRFG